MVRIDFLRRLCEEEEDMIDCDGVVLFRLRPACHLSRKRCDDQLHSNTHSAKQDQTDANKHIFIFTSAVFSSHVLLD